MRLVNFIEGNRGRLVEEWQRFAETLPAFEGQASVAELREHADRVLDAILDGMGQLADFPGSPRHDRKPGDSPTGASEHGLQRHAAGLSLMAMVSEFRALRAVVLRLWAGAGFVRSAEAFEDLVNFNESLDHMITSAVFAFAQAVERDRALLMGIVAHDLRGPLHTISMAAHVLALRHTAVQEDEAMSQIRRSLARTLPMVDDLMGVAAAGLRSRMAITPQGMNLAQLTADIVAEVAAEFPGHQFVLNAREEVHGRWDRARLGQLISNLLRNAAAHGDAAGVVTIRLARQGSEALLSVHNTGAVIPESGRARLFSPATRGANANSGSHLGLGLFIVREIAHSHGGRVDVSSDSTCGTVFSVILPDTATADYVAEDQSATLSS